MKYLLSSLVLVLALSACNSTGEGESAENGWNTHDFEQFEISAPEEWKIDTTGRMGTDFILFAPYDSTKVLFRENLNLVTEDITGQGVDLKGYVENAKGLLDQYMDGFANFQMREDGDRYWLDYQGERQTVILYFHQMIALQDETIHILTFTSNSDTTENSRVADEIMKTFEFKQ